MRFFVTLASLLFFNAAGLCAVRSVPLLQADSVSVHKNGFALHNLTWRFHLADGTDYSDPVIADSTWTIAKTMFGSTTKPKGWTGDGWFRLWLKADESLTGKMLALQIGQNGAAEIYLDGFYIRGRSCREACRRCRRSNSSTTTRRAGRRSGPRPWSASRM